MDPLLLQYVLAQSYVAQLLALNQQLEQGKGELPTDHCATRTVRLRHFLL